MRLFRAALVAAACSAVLGFVGLLTATDYSPAALNARFAIAFYPSVLAGMIVYWRGGKRER